MSKNNTKNFLLVLLIFAGGLINHGCAARGSVEIREAARAAGMRLRHQPVEWKKVHEFSFESPDVMDDFRVVEGDWEIRNGRLCAAGGDRNRALLLARGLEGPVRFEMEVTSYASDGLIGDITVLLNASPDEGFFRSGYALTTGSYWNTCSSFYKKGAVIANTAWSPLVSGRQNQVVAEFNAGHIRYEMNGERILEAWDESPLEMSEDGWIGVRSWATLMCIDRVVIYRGKPVQD